MNDFNLRFHHLGLVVRRPQDALIFLRGLGYEISESVFDPEQGVNLIMCQHASMPAVEVIFPGEAAAPIDALINRNAKGFVYHVAYVTPDLADTVERLQAAGGRPVCLSAPKPAVLFGYSCVAFYNVVGMGLIELIEDRTAISASK